MTEHATTPPAPAATPPAPGAPAPAAAAPPAPPAPTATPPAETLEQTIARLTSEVASARAEAGKERINAKKAAADEATADISKKLGLALGLITEDTPDPVKLLEQVATAQTQARQAAIELAVFRTADAVNGNALALLDSRTFLAKVASIEPTDSAGLALAITEAITENPLLAKASPGAPAASTMQPNRAQGTSSTAALSVDAQIAAAEAAGDTRLAIRLKSAKAIASN